MSLRPFHLAFPVRDLEEARAFYGGLMGCAEGRSSAEWIDFDFYGHQIVAHTGGEAGDRTSNPVDGHDVPVPHFGVVLTMEDWQALAERLVAAGITFTIEPTIRFKGQPGEQATMFFRDPSGNALEFKAFAGRRDAVCEALTYLDPDPCPVSGRHLEFVSLYPEKSSIWRAAWALGQGIPT